MLPNGAHHKLGILRACLHLQSLATGATVIGFYGMMLAVIAWTVFYARRTRPRIAAMMEQEESRRSNPAATFAPQEH